MHKADTYYGNLLLSRVAVDGLPPIDLTISGHEPRGAIHAIVHPGSTPPLTVLATHLGLRTAERHRQLDRLDPYITTTRRPLVLMGDLNAWMPTRDIGTRLFRHFGLQGRPRSFPTRRPLLALDRILVSPSNLCIERGILRSKLSRFASDHYPVWARLDLCG
jgi:endonuclease/exonuclease/phosphatase family metal-dependent hydrolase